MTIWYHQMRPTFISINDNSPNGHGKDLRETLKNMMREMRDMPYMIFQDEPRKPQQVLNSLIESILISDLAIVDLTDSEDTFSKEICVQLGICIALGKTIFYLFVNQNSRNFDKINLAGLSRFEIFTCDQYLEVPSKLGKILKLWQVDRAEDFNSVQVAPSAPGKNFSVFVSDKDKLDDYRECLNDFVANSEWNYSFWTDKKINSKLSVLRNLVAQNSFFVFVIEDKASLEFFTTIGVTIGLGIPFLLAVDKKAEVPHLFENYDNLIRYKSYHELTTKLLEQASTYLTDEIYSYTGSSYFYLLKYLENKIYKVEDISELERIELILNTISEKVSPFIGAIYLVLGDVYRIMSRNTNNRQRHYLVSAKEAYDKHRTYYPVDIRAFESSRSVDNEIQLIDLIERGQYRSIQKLIDLIGSHITQESYKHIRRRLLDLAHRLLEKDSNDQHNSNHKRIDATLLLFAMSRHDKSQEIINLLNNSLDSNQDQESQKKFFLEIIYEMQEEQDFLVNENKNQERLLDFKSHIISILKKEFELQTTKVEEMQIRYDELLNKYNSYAGQIRDMDTQIKIIKHEKEKLYLGKYQESEMVGQLKKFHKEPQSTQARSLIVQFGDEWGIYIILSDKPKIERRGITIEVAKGDFLEYGDEVVSTKNRVSWDRRKPQSISDYQYLNYLLKMYK